MAAGVSVDEGADDRAGEQGRTRGDHADRVPRFGRIGVLEQEFVRPGIRRGEQFPGGAMPSSPVTSVHTRPMAASSVQPVVTARLDATEIRRFTTDFHHSVHIHLVQFQVIR